MSRDNDNDETGVRAGFSRSGLAGATHGEPNSPMEASQSTPQIKRFCGSRFNIDFILFNVACWVAVLWAAPLNIAAHLMYVAACEREKLPDNRVEVANAGYGPVIPYIIQAVLYAVVWIPAVALPFRLPKPHRYSVVIIITITFMAYWMFKSAGIWAQMP